MNNMTAIDLIKNERDRQINSEGYSYEHDDVHTENELSYAAMAYAEPNGLGLEFWPWDKEYFKKDKTAKIDGRIKELVKAGALIVAEIERLQRYQKKWKNI